MGLRGGQCVNHRIYILLYNESLLCDFNVPFKGLTCFSTVEQLSPLLFVAAVSDTDEVVAV